MKNITDILGKIKRQAETVNVNLPLDYLIIEF